ncbi:ATP synthase F0 subunit B [Desulfosoma caldarium]|uniref:ATP synthase subunit b n=1 Tax=Desulfosoma caldarium TaxID=610254 RepID=A0A3N1VN41_9BACT|nr:ATP synthase F0 subunit B [Desulfosoma caldarium]ROR03479.1 F-type H+-transporting ATPase subunit b [Desulfosoma caldarium]
MINVDVTLFIQMANFLLLLVLMNLVLYRPIRRLVAQRNELISKQRAGIDNAEREAQRAIQEFEERLKAARAAGREKVQELKEAAYRVEKDLLSQAAEEAAKEVQAVREQIQREIGQVRAQLQAQIQVFSKDMAQRILGRSL